MKGWAGIARLGGIGDNLVAVSVMRPLKRLGYMTDMITSEAASAVLRNNPFIDKLSIKRDGDIPGGEEWQKWFVKRGNEYDLFVNLSNSMETRHALHKNTTEFWLPQEYRRKKCAGSYLETVHDIAGVPYEFGPLFFPTDVEQEELEKTRKKVGGRYIAWVVGGSRIDKMYPYSTHAVCRIIKELNIPVLLIGGGEQQTEFVKRIEQEATRTNSSTKNLAFAGTVEEDGGVSTSGRAACVKAWGADLVVTPDTGVGWSVAMEPMPKIVMVSHASAENITTHWVNTTTLHADVNRVPCWPCHRLHDDPSTCVPAKDGGSAAACMADIPVETVVENVERLWRKNKNVIRFPSEPSQAMPIGAAE